MAGFKRISDLIPVSDIQGDELLEVSQVSTTVRIASSTISALAVDNSLNDSAAGFITAGFLSGDRVRVTGFSGSPSNNIVAAVITSLTADKMTIGGVDGDVIVNDAAGELVTIAKWVSRRTSVSEAVASSPEVSANTAKVSNATHTGDVTGATALTITNDAVTNAKLANMATATLKGRSTAGTGDPEDLTTSQATALLDTFTSAAKGLAPASGGGTTNFLRADGTWAAPAGGGGGEGVTDGDKGDILVSGGGGIWSVKEQVISNAAMTFVPSGTFKGRIAAGTGAPADLTATQLTSALPLATDAAKGLMPQLSTIATQFLNGAGEWATPAGTGGGGGGIEDAPADNKIYVRRDLEWILLPKEVQIEEHTGAITLALSSASKYIRMASAGAVNVTVPPNSDVAFQIGTVIQIRQAAAGQVAIVAGSGVSISTPETLLLRRLGSTVSLIKVGTNAWDLIGDLESL